MDHPRRVPLFGARFQGREPGMSSLLNHGLHECMVEQTGEVTKESPAACVYRKVGDDPDGSFRKTEA